MERDNTLRHETLSDDVIFNLKPKVNALLETMREVSISSSKESEHNQIQNLSELKITEIFHVWRLKSPKEILQYLQTIHPKIEIKTQDHKLFERKIDKIFDINLLLRNYAEKTYNWYFQISSKGIPIAYVKGKQLGTKPDSIRVIGSFVSDLPGRIHESIEYISTYYESEILNIYLVLIPQLRIHTFWIYDSNNQFKIFIIDHCEDYGFKKNNLYSINIFIEKLISILSDNKLSNVTGVVSQNKFSFAYLNLINWLQEYIKYIKNLILNTKFFKFMRLTEKTIKLEIQGQNAVSLTEELLRIKGIKGKYEAIKKEESLAKITTTVAIARISMLAIDSLYQTLNSYQSSDKSIQEISFITINGQKLPLPEVTVEKIQKIFKGDEISE